MINTQKLKGFIFVAINRKSKEKQTKELIDDCRENTYYSYYVNHYGEQLVFEHNFDTQESFLYHSDMEWQPRKVVNKDCPSLALDKLETLWLNVCCETILDILKD